jgi:hypothetical protein
MKFILIINIIFIIVGVLMVFLGLGSFFDGELLTFFSGIGIIIQSSFWIIVIYIINKLETQIYRVQAKVNLINK